jgi:hypothetical protein
VIEIQDGSHNVHAIYIISVIYSAILSWGKCNIRMRLEFAQPLATPIALAGKPKSFHPIPMGVWGGGGEGKKEIVGRSSTFSLLC